MKASQPRKRKSTGKVGGTEPKSLAVSLGGTIRAKDGAEARVNLVLKTLKKLYPDAGIELNFSNPLELLIATILSAQCTDVRVNQVTNVLFQKFRKINDYIERPIEELEEIIHSAGFFRQKARSIRGTVAKILERFGGEVPANMAELVKLPGVGRKTANVILGNAFGIPGLPVDTHVIRLSNRLGLTHNADPEKIEQDLCGLLPKSEWTLFSHLLIWHGRRMCKARKPECSRCPLSASCKFYAESLK